MTSHKLGNTNFTLPFKSEGLWVVDDRGRNVGEFTDRAIAKSVAESLNAAAKSTAL